MAVLVENRHIKCRIYTNVRCYFWSVTHVFYVDGLHWWEREMWWDVGEQSVAFLSRRARLPVGERSRSGNIYSWLCQLLISSCYQHETKRVIHTNLCGKKQYVLKAWNEDKNNAFFSTNQTKPTLKELKTHFMRGYCDTMGKCLHARITLFINVLYYSELVRWEVDYEWFLPGCVYDYHCGHSLRSPTWTGRMARRLSKHIVYGV